MLARGVGWRLSCCSSALVCVLVLENAREDTIDAIQRRVNLSLSQPVMVVSNPPSLPTIRLSHLCHPNSSSHSNIRAGVAVAVGSITLKRHIAHSLLSSAGYNTAIDLSGPL